MAKHHHKDATSSPAVADKPTTPTKPVVASVDHAHKEHLTLEENIRMCAYRKWEAAGRPAGDGVQFWLEAERELVERKNEPFAWQVGRDEDRAQERMHADKAVKADHVNVDSHYRDNNRMFQTHGERGHRHGGGA